MWLSAMAVMHQTWPSSTSLGRRFIRQRRPCGWSASVTSRYRSAVNDDKHEPSEVDWTHVRGEVTHVWVEDESDSVWMGIQSQSFVFECVVNTRRGKSLKFFEESLVVNVVRTIT